MGRRLPPALHLTLIATVLLFVPGIIAQRFAGVQRMQVVHPELKVTYKVHYATDLLQEQVTDACGRYYAELFLQNFWSLQSNFTALCAHTAHHPHVQSRVEVHMVAMVHIMGPSVNLDIYIRIQANGTSASEADIREAITTCNRTLEDSFANNIAQYEDAEHAFLTLPPQAENNCTAVRMGPERLLWASDVWQCPEGMTLSLPHFICFNSDSTWPTPLSTHGSSTQRDSECSHDAASACIANLSRTLNRFQFCWIKDVCTQVISEIIPAGDRNKCERALSEVSDASGFDCDDDPSVTPSSPAGTTPSIYTSPSTPLATPPPDTPTTQVASTTRDTETTTDTGSTTAAVQTTTTDERGVETTSQDPSSTMTTEGYPAPTSTIAMTTPSMPLPDAWGVHVKSNMTTLELTEGNGEASITLRAWANVSSVCEGMTNCRLSVQVRFTHGAMPRCRSDNSSIAQIVVRQPLGAASDNFCSIPLEALTMDTDLTLPLKAKLDSKYDGSQVRILNISLKRVVDDILVTEVPAATIAITVNDGDKNAICSSINDPHIGTFDGLEYNNYHEGEFVLYQHNGRRFQVHAVYQRCGKDVNASCNCAVAVKSDDDVIVIDKCARRSPVFEGLGPTSENTPTILSQTIYLNGELTPGTRIFSENDGKKMNIYLPLGTYVKVTVNDNFLNVWVIPSPNDIQNTAGLCGNYNGRKSDDLVFQHGRIDMLPDMQQNGSRPHPTEFVLNWRVEIGGPDSILSGVPAEAEPYKPEEYCECEMDSQTPPKCGYAFDVETCDIYQGVDVTESLLATSAVSPNFSKRRKKRQTTSNSVITVPTNDPIDIDTNFIPPVPEWQDGWNAVTARSECENAIRYSEVGQLCSQIPSVNIEEEIKTCIEDIQITNGTAWITSAKEALLEKCLEEVQRDESIPDDLASQIEGLCPNNCTHNGQCQNDIGECICEADYATYDCSVSRLVPPEIIQMPAYGLCDVRYMNCANVIVYGQDFINSTALTCHLRQVQVTEGMYTVQEESYREPALFINFNAVQCPIPNVVSYLVSISNNGLNDSNPLLFIPFDSLCNDCSTNTTTCRKVRNSCIIDGQCYGEGELSADNCLICSPLEYELEWTSVDDPRCTMNPTTIFLTLPDWLVAVIAALAGSIIGVLCGFVLYWCCCKSSSCCQDKPSRDDFSLEDPDEDPQSTPTLGPAADSQLHRHPDLSPFSHPNFGHLGSLHQPGYEETANDGRGVENGVNDLTYF